MLFSFVGNGPAGRLHESDGAADRFSTRVANLPRLLDASPARSAHTIHGRVGRARRLLSHAGGRRMRTSPGQVVAMTISVALLSLGGIAVPGTVAGASSGPATPISPVVDQSFTSADNSSSLINEGARFVAQIFTAGRTGLLTGVNVDVLDCCNSPYALDVALRTVGPTGAPTDTVLAEER